MSIQTLIQEDKHKWVAIYNGNYGIYTIKIRFNEDNSVANYSCSCPSDYFPCKHIDMILAAIGKKQINISKNNGGNDNKELINKLITGTTKEKFINFLIHFSDYNPDFVNKIKLEFFTEKEVKQQMNINSIIRQGLPDGRLDDDYYDQHYNEDYIELEILDEWKEKAEKEIENQNFDDALEIGQAILEEFANWRVYCDEEFLEYLNEDYEYYPFEIFNSIINTKNGYSERIIKLLKEKYTVTEYQYAQPYISNFVGNFSESDENKNFFLETQNQLLKKASSDYDRERILSNIIDFYRKEKQPNEEWTIVFENLDIDKFRKKAIEKYIQDNKFSEAKNLTNEKIKLCNGHREPLGWYEYLLQMAQLENKNNEIRDYSYLFIKSDFNKKYYTIFKATFKEEEWEKEFIKLEKLYNKNNYFNSSLVNLWLEENQKTKALNYFLKYKNLQTFENYAVHFKVELPKETLSIYKESLNEYAKNNLGRKHYEYIAEVLKRIKQIEGGTSVLNEILNSYKTEYKKRPAMMEILNQKFKI